MATRAAPSYVGTRLSKRFTAKCEANQPLVEIIAEKHEKAGHTNFAFTLKKAAESICKENVTITTFEEAVALKGIGPTIARMLGFSKSYGDAQKENNSAGKKSRAKKGAPKRAASDSASLPSSPSSIASSSSVAERRRKPKLAARQERGQALSTIQEKPSRKELAYQKAVQESQSWKGRSLKWRMVLLIDQRERKAEHYASKIEQCGIPTAIRSLPIGDMCWIAQGFEGSVQDGKLIAELMLGTIIERKEVSDLKNSLFGTRYHEQQLRLRDSGQPQVIFLVEGDTKKDQYKCPAETLHTTMWAIRIEKQNQVIQTAHTAETVQTLRRMHRRMLQRTFPTAFYAEALPAFTGPDVGGHRSRPRDSFGEQRRKRRRRLESLHGLTFDEEPIPMAGMSRFVTYRELRAKVERDREAGRRTVGSIHQAMLKQVATISDVKIIPISGEYPTANSLLKAYDEVPEHSERKKLLEGLELSTGISTGPKGLGPRSAGELYITYGLDQGENRRESVESNASGSSYVERVAKFRSETTTSRVEDADLREALIESVRSSNRSTDSPGTSNEGVAGFPKSASICASAASGLSIPGLSNDVRPKQTAAKTPPPFEAVVDLLSSEDEGDCAPTATAPPAKRHRSSISSIEGLLSTSDGKMKIQAATCAATFSTAGVACDADDDDELDALLGNPQYRKKPAKRNAIADTEVIEID